MRTLECGARPRVSVRKAAVRKGQPWLRALGSDLAADRRAHLFAADGSLAGFHQTDGARKQPAGFLGRNYLGIALIAVGDLPRGIAAHEEAATWS